EGRPAVVAVEILLDSARAFAAGLASALARGSQHPLSQAIAKISAHDAPVRDWREIRGGGLEARRDDNTMARLGSLAWLQQCRVDVARHHATSEKWMNEGATVVGLSLDAQLLALIALRDNPKPGAAEVVARFRRQNLKTRLVTGDNRRTALAIARQLGLADDEVFAEVRPEEKASLVRQFQETGERVAFVGDGINDAPALEQADLGIAVNQASDIAGEAADIVLLQSDIHAIPEAIDLARAALRTVKQNLFWAFFYNAAALPLAALGFISPI